ncbi:response regulator [Actinoplanes sp. NPDC026670]|uniref:response regulator transcription factor n=1 Tax=Actinoplanes sp. NPDC026670 TaxID=3154700 RepID=UPI0033E0269D
MTALMDIAPVLPRTTAGPMVLVVDDDEGVRDLVAFKLEMAGYRTVTAADGCTALTLIGESRPDLVVLDIAMPGMDGLSVCYQMHADPATAEIPVIMLSGMATETDIDLAYVSGAEEYMPKPVNPGELVRRVSWLLPRRH